MVNVGLTPCQLAMLRFIQGYQIAHGGVSPSLRECAIGVGVVQKSTAHRTLEALEWRGAIRRLPNRDRAIEIIRPVPVPSIAGAPLYAVAPMAGGRFDQRTLP